MLLQDLKLVNFRNYELLQWQPHAGLNFLSGLNAQGKTNLLEAIFFCALGYSFRKKDRDVIKWGSSDASLQATYKLNHQLIDVTANISNEGKKKILVNGAEDNRKYLPGRFGIILFKPDDLEIIKGSPSRRRDFIDNDISMIDSVYRRNLYQYRRVLEQRNNLLKNYSKKNRETLEVWNEHFFRYGSQVLSGRIKMLKKFVPLVREIYSSIAGDGELLEIKYLSSVKISGGIEDDQIINDFIIEGKTREKEELLKKQSIFGPHRDDIVFLLNQKDARSYGSQGQVRSIVLALKTAQIKLFGSETGENPILLLDDVLMELDDTRQEYLMQLIYGKVQSFITSTMLPDKITKYVNRVYLINRGAIKEENKCFYTSEGM